jgi:hypothetical protein
MPRPSTIATMTPPVVEPPSDSCPRLPPDAPAESPLVETELEEDSLDADEESEDDG